MVKLYANEVDEEMIVIPEGTFLMGASEEQFGYPEDGEFPQRPVKINSFLIDKFSVTNKLFNEFVKETSYITDSEKYGWSFVFYDFLSDEIYNQSEEVVLGSEWWVKVESANWKYPYGQLHQQAITEQEEYSNHPVVHISWNDALHFCEHYGKRLPTEAEWEYASRGGLESAMFPWGNARRGKNKEIMCNTYQGEFPMKNLKLDGYESTCPVDHFEPNGYGIYNTVGNVWEWVNDWFSIDHNLNIDAFGNFDVIDNPLGPELGTEKVQKGGSYMCHRATCYRFRNSARVKNTPESAAGNTGFRCAKSI